MNKISHDRNIFTHARHIVKVIKAGAKKLHNTKFYVALVALVVLIGTPCLFPAIYSSMNGVVIRSSGQIHAREVWANSGSAEDIQAAVNAVAAAGGGNVHVPGGDFVFNPDDAPSGAGVKIPGGVSVFGAGKDWTVLRQTRQVATNMPMFEVDGSNDLPSRISGFTFIGYILDEASGHGATGIVMYNCRNFRVDNCKFIDFNNFGISTRVYASAAKWENGEYQYWWNWGVIDHCDFDNPYKDTVGGSWGYGVGVFGGGSGTAPYAWLYDLSDILGRWDIENNARRCALYEWNAAESKYDLVDPYGGKYFRWLVYIEDCTFSRCRHAIASNGGSFYVARHNSFKEDRPVGWPQMDAHGAMGNEGWWGGRGYEAYDNTIDETLYAAGGWAIDYRGGGGVAFNNTIINCQYGVSMRYEGTNTNGVCWVNDLWIWDNNFQNVTTPIHDPYSLYDEEVHYFLRQRPDYMPYMYPHPLAQETTP